MRNTSFHEILLQFLEENGEQNAPKPEEKPSTPLWEPAFQWQAPELKKSFGYPKSAAKPAPPQAAAPAPTPPPPPKPEPRYLLATMSDAARAGIAELILLGATEFKGIETLSRSELKKAHRRLVKRLHPDAGGDQERFLRVQKAYDVVSSALACGNGSASAEASRRRDAA